MRSETTGWLPLALPGLMNGQNTEAQTCCFTSGE
jgi:hypothetical protein